MTMVRQSFRRARLIRTVLAAAFLGGALSVPLYAYDLPAGIAHVLSRQGSNRHAARAGAGMSITQGQPNTGCPQFQIYGYPRPVNAQTRSRAYYTCRLGYAGLYDPQEKTPLWIAEHLDANYLGGRADRKGMAFREDPQIPAAQDAQPDDYRGSGFDKGHMAPAADFHASRPAMEQTFLLSNAVPQNPANNRGIWANLEAGVREWTARRGELYVITGPIYGNAARQKIGRGVSVPDALFKVVVDGTRREMTAFVIPNRADLGDDPSRYQVRVRDVERMTGLDFNPSLSRSDADRLESAGGDWLLPRVRSRLTH